MRLLGYPLIWARITAGRNVSGFSASVRLGLRAQQSSCHVALCAIAGWSAAMATVANKRSAEEDEEAEEQLALAKRPRTELAAAAGAPTDGGEGAKQVAVTKEVGAVPAILRFWGVASWAVGSNQSVVCQGS